MIQLNYGRMSEWSNVSVSKTDIPKGIGGSNPPSSAKNYAIQIIAFFYLFAFIEYCLNALVQCRLLLVVPLKNHLDSDFGRQLA